MKIVIAAGGTGGHLLPAQQLAKALQPNAEILFAGHQIDRSPFFERGEFSFLSISSAPLRKSPLALLKFAREMAKGIWQSVRFLRAAQPDLVVGFGSFHSFPVLLFAAALLRKKIALFEANCLLGKVNRLFAPLAQIVGAQFALQRAPKRLSFVPLLPWKEYTAVNERRQARMELGLDPDRTTILVFGGSQGAAFLNRAVPEALACSMQAIHLAGNEGAAKETAARYEKANIKAVVKGFESNMARAYAAADLAICRSGAGTMAELIRAGLPALLIPYPFAADDHQKINAEFLAKKIGGAKMVVEREADRETLSRLIGQLVEESEGMKQTLQDFRKECEGRVRFSEQILNMGRV